MSNFPTTRQLNDLIKLGLSTYKEGFEEANPDIKLDFQMPIANMTVNPRKAAKRVLDKNPEISKEDKEAILKKQEDKDVDIAYLRLEKIVTSTYRGHILEKDWVIGLKYFKYNKATDEWFEEVVGENEDVPEDVEDEEKYQMLRTKRDKNLLFHTSYEYKNEKEKKKKYDYIPKQFLYLNVIQRLMLAGIEYAEAMESYNRQKQMEEKIAQEVQKEKESMDKMQSKVTKPDYSIQKVSSMRNEEPLNKEDKDYVEWVKKERAKMGIKDD
jgi:hypothetical protein